MSGEPERDRHGGRWDTRKKPRKSAAAGSSEGMEAGIETTDFEELAREQGAVLEALSSPINSKAIEGIYDMQEPGEREQLARDIWTVDLSDAMTSIRDANAELVPAQ